MVIIKFGFRLPPLIWSGWDMCSLLRLSVRLSPLDFRGHGGRMSEVPALTSAAEAQHGCS